MYKTGDRHFTLLLCTVLIALRNPLLPKTFFYGHNSRFALTSRLRPLWLVMVKMRVLTGIFVWKKVPEKIFSNNPKVSLSIQKKWKSIEKIKTEQQTCFQKMML